MRTLHMLIPNRAPRPLAMCSTQQSEGEPLRPRPVAAASGAHRASLEVLVERGAVALGPTGREESL